MYPLFLGNLGAGEIIVILFFVLPIALLIRALIRYLNRH